MKSKLLSILGCGIITAAVVASMAAFPYSAAETGYIKGDADGDGAVTINDVTAVQRVLSQLVGDPDGAVALRGDVSGGGLSIDDATEIQRYLAEHENELQIGSFIAPEQPTTTEETQQTTSKRDPYELPFVPNY